MSKNRLLQGFQELKSYHNFDTKCHEKLQNFSRIIERLGIYKIKNGFT